MKLMGELLSRNLLPLGHGPRKKQQTWFRPAPPGPGADKKKKEERREALPLARGVVCVESATALHRPRRCAQLLRRVSASSHRPPFTARALRTCATRRSNNPRLGGPRSLHSRTLAEVVGRT